jgi:hypothetical protein
MRPVVGRLVLSSGGDMEQVFSVGLVAGGFLAVLLMGAGAVLLRGSKRQELEFEKTSTLDAYRQLLAPAQKEIAERAKRTRG